MPEAKIIEFPQNKGNGAREAVMEILDDNHMRMPLGEWDYPAVTDYWLGRLWEAGFKVVPLQEPD